MLEARLRGLGGKTYQQQVLSDMPGAQPSALGPSARRAAAVAEGKGALGQAAATVGGAKDKLNLALQYREEGQKLVGFAARIRAGDSPMTAAYHVEGTFGFDYANISPAADFLRKTGMAPFAVWSIKNVPAQLRFFVEHPAEYVVMLRAIDELSRGGGNIQPENLRGYRRNNWQVSTGIKKDAQGKAVWSLVSPSNVIPISDLVDLHDHTRAYLMRQAGPLVEVLHEMLYNEPDPNQTRMEQFKEAAVKGIGAPASALRAGLRAFESPLDERTLEERASWVPAAFGSLGRAVGATGAAYLNPIPFRTQEWRLEEGIKAALAAPEKEVGFAKWQLHNALKERERAQLALYSANRTAAAAEWVAGLAPEEDAAKAAKIQQTLVSINAQVKERQAILATATREAELAKQRAGSLRLKMESIQRAP
jgi:hypothetical protein